MNSIPDMTGTILSSFLDARPSAASSVARIRRAEQSSDSGRHHKSPTELSAINPYYSCETGDDGFYGLNDAPIIFVEYDYELTTNSTIEPDVKKVMPHLERFMNDEIIAEFFPDCGVSGRRLADIDIVLAVGMIGISSTPLDEIQNDAIQNECDAAFPEVCDYVRGYLTVYATGQNELVREQVREVIRVGMTPPSETEDAKFKEAHPAIVGFRFITDDFANVEEMPDPSPSPSPSPSSGAAAAASPSSGAAATDDYAGVEETSDDVDVLDTTENVIPRSSETESLRGMPGWDTTENVIAIIGLAMIGHSLYKKYHADEEEDSSGAYSSNGHDEIDEANDLGIDVPRDVETAGVEIT